jgi:hypothetical protein
MYEFELTSRASLGRVSLGEKISLATAAFGAVIGLLACISYFAMLA